VLVRLVPDKCLSHIAAARSQLMRTCRCAGLHWAVIVSTLACCSNAPICVVGSLVMCTPCAHLCPPPLLYSPESISSFRRRFTLEHLAWKCCEELKCQAWFPSQTRLAAAKSMSATTMALMADSIPASPGHRSSTAAKATSEYIWEL
jgi:hypothetical protein